MRNMKVNKKSVIAMIFGLFLLGSTIIINTFSADAQRIPFNDYKTNRPNDITANYLEFDFQNMNFSLYLLGELLDNDDNSLGYVNITGGYWLEPDGRYYVYGSACAETAIDVEGETFASGELAGRGEVVDGPNWNYIASAWDAFHTKEPPSGPGKAYASLTVDDVKIWISVEGAL